MRITFACPECGTRIQESDIAMTEYSGHWGLEDILTCPKCPKCAKLTDGPGEASSTRVFCKNCYFHRQFNDECREDSPAMDADGRAEWPSVKPFMWCGKGRLA